MKNIGRPINFYNNFLPAKDVNHNWQYCAFGVLDGVSVDDPFYEQDTEDDTILKQIWARQNELTKELKGNYAVQTIYAVCYADEEEEKAFWKQMKPEENDFPFVFFCRMQYQGDLQALRKNKDALKKELEKDGKIKTWIYLTYDNSDLLIVIKAASYEIGEGAINSMYKEINFAFAKDSLCFLKNSFTVFAVEQEFINQLGNKQTEAKKSVYDVMNETKIEQVIIKVIEKKFGCAKQLQAELGKVHDERAIEIRHILGTDDENIILNKIGWGTFLKLYQSETGIFHNTSSIYNEYIAGATTTICTCIEEKDYFAAQGTPNALLKKQQQWETLYNARINNVRECLNKKNGNFKELYTILNTLPKFLGTVFSDYLYFFMLGPLETLVELQPDRRKDQKCRKSHDDAYYEFIKGVNMYIQNSIKSDRYTMQMMDFNSKIYDIPVKLSAFYVAFIYGVCSVLNISEREKESHHYDFFVVPGATNIVTVLELYSKQDDKRRLLRVEIPENRFYDLPNMMRIFSHEVAHYVGTGLRNREKRYEAVLKNIADIYMNYIKAYWYDEVQPKEDAWETISQRVFYMLKDLFAYKLDRDYLEKVQLDKLKDNDKMKRKAEDIVKYNNKHWSGMDFFRKNSYSAISDIIWINLDNIYQDITYGMPKEEQKEMLKRAKLASRRFLARHIEGSTLMTMDTIYESLESVYEECFSDLASIFLLDLDARAYLDTLISEAGSQDMSVETLIETEVMYRITLVMDVLKEKKGDTWLEGVDYEDTLKEDRIKIIKRSRIMHNNAIESCKYDEDYVKSSFRALIDKRIYLGIRDYLCQCYELFVENVQGKEITEIYQCLCDTSESIEDRIGRMESYIEQYRQTITNT